MGEKLVYRNPGHGSILFAEAFIIGATDRQEALLILSQIYNGEIPVQDKRVKRCAYCGYIYYDKTRPNNSVVCSPECRAARNVLRRKEKRHKEKSPRKTKREEHYRSMPDGYDFWIDETEMDNYHDARGSLYDDQKIEKIVAAKQRAEILGGKRKPKYNDESNYKTVPRMGERKLDREPGEIETSRMKDVGEYLRNKYGSHKLSMERKTARRQAQGK